MPEKIQSAMRKKGSFFTGNKRQANEHSLGGVFADSSDPVYDQPTSQLDPRIQPSYHTQMMQ